MTERWINESQDSSFGRFGLAGRLDSGQTKVVKSCGKSRSVTFRMSFEAGSLGCELHWVIAVEMSSVK